jgi:ribosome biogenesis protein MAK21
MYKYFLLHNNNFILLILVYLTITVTFLSFIAMHQIVKLLEAHPAMTPIVMEEIEHLMYRPNVSNKAQYYGICCLTQFTLDDSRPEIANHLIKIYFSFFKASIKKGEVDTKMVSALLTGK